MNHGICTSRVDIKQEKKGSIHIFHSPWFDQVHFSSSKASKPSIQRS